MHKDKPKPKGYDKDRRKQADQPSLSNWEHNISPPWDYAPVAARLQDCRLQLLLAGLITERENVEIVRRFNKEIARQRQQRLRDSAKRK